MTITVDGTFENGQLKLKQPVALAEGTPVQVTITYEHNAARDPLGAIIGACESGRTDGAQNHDQYLYGKRS